ncbi:MAG: response regulator [Phycisphaerae bacterium]|nr:response regulator [Phycisphaerae bacterium]
MKLLLADDDSKIHLIVKMWLNRSGHDVTSVRNGQEALDLIREEYFDGLITDANMPLMTGMELIKYVLLLPDPPDMIVLLTSRCDVKEIKADINSEKVHLFNKPFSPSALTGLIETLRKDVCASPK